MFEEYSNDLSKSKLFPPLKMNGTTTVVQNAALATIYFAAAGLSLLLAIENTNASPVWPATGIALAAVLLLGYRIWPGILIGAFVANIFTLHRIGFATDTALIMAFLTAIGNTLEALAGGFLVRLFADKGYIFKDTRGTFVFVVFGAFLSTMVSATIGVTTLSTVTAKWSLYGSIWLTWWLGDATGALLIAPLLLSWKKRGRTSWTYSTIAESFILLILLCIISHIIYVLGYPLEFLIAPVLLWIILRFGLFETSLSIAILSGVAVFGTARATSFITGNAFNQPLVLIQSHIGIVAMTALFLSVIVSDKKLSGEALLAEKAFTDTIINSVPGAFYVLNQKGQLVRWNRLLEELNDVPSEKLTGMDSLKNIYADDRKIISDKIVEAFAKGESETEGRIRAKGEIRHFVFTGKRIDVEEISYVVGTGIDITARKSAELQLEEYQRNLEAMVAERTEKLTELNVVLAAEIEERRNIEKVLSDSEEKYRDVVEGANSVILRWTREGEIVFINRFAREFFGYSEEEILGRNIVGTIVPITESTGRDLSSLAKNIHENPEEYILNENENIKKNGERVWVAWTNRAIVSKDGQIVEILSVGNDITRRKVVEDHLKVTLDELAAAKERAEAADRLKSAFLATMSHELRTPLNSIIGFTGIILGGYVGPLNEEQAKQLGMVRNSANHLLSLINDVLDISKIEAGQLQVSLEPFSIRALIDKVVQSSYPALEKKGLTLSVNISDNIDLITSDCRRVEQILINLINNAIKFTDSGEIHVDCMPADGSVQISVADSGIGIKEEDASKLFKAFQQVDSGTTRKFEGTGLGLYICQKLLALLGGKIWVRSRWGSGSTFCFSLPVERRTP